MKLKGFIITGLLLIVAGFIVSIVGFSNEEFDLGNIGFAPTIETYQYNVDEIDTIIYDSDVDELEIRPAAGNQIQIITKCVNGFGYTINIEGKSLVIEQFSDSIFANDSCEVIIEIPQNALVNLDIEIDTGEVEIKNVKASNVSVLLDIGNVDITSVSFSNLNVEVDVGDIDINLNGSPADYTINGKGTGSKIVTAKTDIGELDIEYGN